MKLRLVDRENSKVNFLNFYAYNYLNNTNINRGNTLIFANAQFGISYKMFMSYPSKIYVVSLYHDKLDDNYKNCKKFVASNSYIVIEDIELIKNITLKKVDYIVIAEKVGSSIDDIKELVNNILFITKSYNNISYSISTTEAKVIYSSFDSKKENKGIVEFTFYKEVLGKDKFANVEKEAIVNTKKKKENTVENKEVSIPGSWILCNNNIFYNILSIVLIIACMCIIGSDIWVNGGNISRNCYAASAISIIITLVFISALQYVRIDNNKKNKHKK